MHDSDLDADAVLAFLRSFSEPGTLGAGYLGDHLKRFVETLRLLPPGGPGKELLELGAAYHHLTPAFARFRGWTDITCTDLWEGDARTRRTIESRDGAFSLEVDVDNFDVETGPYPYEDSRFDVVVCCEILEHLSHDPMHMLREIHRILKPGGALLLTTPNLASAKSFAYVLQGQSPYVWGQYPVGGRATDRHNREYTALEVRKLVELGGFRVESLATAFSWWPVDPKVFEMLDAVGASKDLRGDNTLALARRAGPPQARYPAEFYHGGEVGRELPQDAVAASAAGACAGATSPADAADPADARVAPLRLLVVNNIVPNHDRGGSCFRMMTLLRLLSEDGHAIEYLARDAKGMERYVHDLEAMGIRVHATDPERLRVWDDVPGDRLDVEAIVRQGRFDVAILLLWFWSSPSIPEQYLHEIRRASPQTRIVVLSDDVHWLHDLRMARVTGKRSDLERAQGYRARELEVYRRADLVSAITQDDAAVYLEEDPALPVSVLPHFIPPRDGPAPGFEARRDLVTVGAFGYHANVDAVRWFVRHVWPAVREELPGVRLHVVGGSPPDEIRNLASDEIVVTGWVPDIVAHLDQRRVFVSAIRYGTGLKTKNIQAMGNGVPLVGTTISLAGSGAVPGLHALVEDDPGAFARAVVGLYTDEAAWSRQAAAARRLATETFGRKTVLGSIRATLARAAALEARRQPDAGDWSITRVERADPRIVEAATAAERFRYRITAHLRLYGELLAAGRADDAIEELRRLLAHCGQGAFRESPAFFAGVMCRFGDAYRVAGRTEDALAAYREALDLDPAEEDAVRALREAGGEPSSAAGRPEPLAIEGRRGFAFLCEAHSGDGWTEPVTAFVRAFRPGDDVCLIVAGPTEKLETDLLRWLGREGLDPSAVPDLIVVPQPRDEDEAARLAAAANAFVAGGAGCGGSLRRQAERLGIDVLPAREAELKASATSDAPADPRAVRAASRP